MRVEVLYFDGCPGHDRLMRTLPAMASAHDAEVVQCRVETLEEAEELRFLGSPSVRVDGRDVEPGAESRTDYGAKCRLYRTAGGQLDAPPDEWIRRAMEGGQGG